MTGSFNAVVEEYLALLPRVLAAGPTTASPLRAVAEALTWDVAHFREQADRVQKGHWLDTADQGGDAADDLARLAALFGLVPRAGESVEEFRRSVPHYVRLFVRGTATPRGVLSVAGLALGLNPFGGRFDYWWDRPDDAREVVRPRSDSAGEPVFGVPAAAISGERRGPAEIRGTVPLPARLARAAVLRLAVDGHTFEVPLPAGSPPDDVVAWVNAAWERHELTVALLTSERTAYRPPLARRDGDRLVLTSPAVGPAGRVAVLEGPEDAAADVLGLLPHTYLGATGAAAEFVAPDAFDRIDLSDEYLLRLRIDGGRPMLIDCAGSDPARTTIDEVYTAINNVFARTVAGVDERGRLRVTSPTVGPASRVQIVEAGAHDATARVLGVRPRAATGRADRAARLLSADLLPAGRGGFDLREHRRVGLRIDGGPLREVDLAATAENVEQVRPFEIVTAVNAAFGPGTAAISDQPGEFGRVAIASRQPDDRGSVELTPPTDRVRRRFVTRMTAPADAALRVLGGAADVQATPDVPAEVVGTVDLLLGVDLSECNVLRIALDGDPPRDVPVVGFRASAVFGDEIVAAVNAVYPGLADLTADERLRLHSRTAYPRGRVRVEPVLYLDLAEYPPTPARAASEVAPGATFVVPHAGVTEGPIDLVEIECPNGTATPTLVNTRSHWGVRVRCLLGPGGRLRIRPHPVWGVRAERVSAGGAVEPVPPGAVAVGPRGLQVAVPTAGPVAPAPDAAGDLTVQLNDPFAPRLVLLRARTTGGGPRAVTVQATLAATAATEAAERFVGRVKADRDSFVLVGADDNVVAGLAASDDLPLAAFEGAWVAVRGPARGTAARLVSVESIGRLFDLELYDPASGTAERYPAVCVGGGAAADSLAAALLGRSALMTADERPKAAVLRMAPGESRWAYADGAGARYGPPTAVERFEKPAAEAWDADGGLVGRANAAACDGGSDLVRVEVVASPGRGALPVPWHTWARPTGDPPRVEFDDTAAGGSKKAVRVSPRPDGRADRIEVRIVPAADGRVRLEARAIPTYGAARFADPDGPPLGLFDFATADRARFGPGDPDGAVRVTVDSTAHAPGAAELHLPVELPPRYGARFGEGRFAQDGPSEGYEKPLTERWDAPGGAIERLNAATLGLLLVDLGPGTDAPPRSWWGRVPVPSRGWAALTGGAPGRPAAVNLTDPRTGESVFLQARAEGAGGNQIEVRARLLPGDLVRLEVRCPPAVFESARDAVRGPELGYDRPGLGVLQTKAVGVRVDVRRDGFPPTPTPPRS